MTSNAAAIYVRMSKDRTGAGLGVARQERECRELADRLGLTVTAVYSDNDLSAYKGKERPGYVALLNAVESGSVSSVICWHPDRLTRRTSELERYIAVTAAIPTYTVTAGTFDLTTPSGRATAKTVAAWAQAEVEQKVLRQKAKNRQLAEAGNRMPGGPIPFGYSDDRSTPHPVHGELVRKAYADVLAGKGLAAIAMDWQKAGAPVPQSTKGRWDRASVKRVLSRETNAGMVIHQGKVVPGVVGSWTPLVSVGDFYAARTILTDPARRTSPGSAPKYLLSGIATCASCGAPLRRQRVGSLRADGTKRDDLYACTNTKALRGDCPAPVSVSQPNLDEWFTETLLTERGNRPGMTVGLPDADAAAEGEKVATLAELDARVRGIALQMADPDADVLSLTEALTAAKAERKLAEAAPVVYPEDTLTIAQSWNADPSGDGSAQVIYRRKMVRTQLAKGGLTISPVGRGKRLPISERVSVAWID